MLAHPAILAGLAGAARRGGVIVAIHLAAQGQPRTVRQGDSLRSSSFIPKNFAKALPLSIVCVTGFNPSNSIHFCTSSSPMTILVLIVFKVMFVTDKSYKSLNA